MKKFFLKLVLPILAISLLTPSTPLAQVTNRCEDGLDPSNNCCAGYEKFHGQYCKCGANSQVTNTCSGGWYGTCIPRFGNSSQCTTNTCTSPYTEKCIDPNWQGNRSDYVYSCCVPAGSIPTPTPDPDDPGGCTGLPVCDINTLLEPFYSNLDYNGVSPICTTTCSNLENYLNQRWTIPLPYRCIIPSYTINPNYLFHCSSGPGTPGSGIIPPGSPPSTLPPPGGEPRPRYRPLNEYPFPCDQVAPENSSNIFSPPDGDDEFHSLRPYQASPCRQTLTKYAAFCGNSLVLAEDVTIDYSPGAPTCDFADIDNTNCCDQDTVGDGDGITTCRYTITGSRDVTVELEGAQLPIMGYTEPSVGNVGNSDPNVTNSLFQTQDETLDDPAKVNEYVSWYLNGVTNRAEYPKLSNDEDDQNKIINFSGPLKKLLPQTVQRVARLEQIDEAVAALGGDDTRHNQVVGCTYGLGPWGFTIGNFPGPCYMEDDGFLNWIISFYTRRRRLADWDAAGRRPPLDGQFDDYRDYYVAERRWRGDACADITVPSQIPIIGDLRFTFCFDVPWNPNFYAQLFEYIPFTNTEDKLGAITIKASSVSSQNNVRIVSSIITNQEPSYLYFPHMREDLGLAELLQGTFAPGGANLQQMTNPGYQLTSPYCDLREVRTNPGDELFGNDLKASIDYQAEVTCDFFDGDSQLGDWCRSEGGICETVSTDPFRRRRAEIYYPRLDCPTGEICKVDPSDLPLDDVNCIQQNGQCVPRNWTGCTQLDPYNTFCGDGYVCAQRDPSCTYLPATAPQQQCNRQVWVNMQLETWTPLAHKIWARLVAGDNAVFKRMFPKVDEDGPVTELWQIPASTNVAYNAPGLIFAGNPGYASSDPSSAQIYFPYIGGIKEYFLTGIQTMLRPWGYGEQILSSSPADIFPSGCPAPMWPITLSGSQSYYISQGPGGAASHGPPRFSYQEAVDIAPLGGLNSSHRILSTHNGVAQAAGVDGYGGLYVFNRSNCGLDFISNYVHMSSLAVSTGQDLTTGQDLGPMGCTGFCMGPHVHYEFRNENGSLKDRSDPPPFLIEPFVPVTVPQYCLGNCGITIQ